MANIAFVTLGCKANQFETQAMELEAQRLGHTLVSPEEHPDILILNSCAVTSNAGKKSRQELHAARRNSPGVLLAVCGCYARMVKDELLQNQEADLVSGNRDHRAFLAETLALYEKRLAGSTAPSPSFFDGPEREFEFLPAGSLTGRTRALLKIQDGCDNYCTYCIIPYLRGHIRSLAPELCEQEVARLAAEGYREIVLTGIEIASYGRDLTPQTDLGSLLVRLNKAAGGARLRLGSLEPRTVTEEFCLQTAELSCLCPHFHLSLQSGSDGVLRRMGRKYDTALFGEVADRLRHYFPAASLTTDIIVGFPGETEEEFHETEDFCRRIGFERVHIFPYSIREGTPAARMPGQCTRATKEERAARLATLTDAIALERRAALVGKEFRVLFETGEKEGSSGYTESYQPFFLPENIAPGTLLTVRAEALVEGRLTGSVL